jgi:DNA-binding response OmpR family regulator
LLARIKTVLRRAGGGPTRLRAPDAAAYAFGPWVLRTGERELIDAGGVAVPLSTGEYNLLLALVTHARRVLSRDQLLDLAQGREMGAFDRSVDNVISRLRRKIEADPKRPVLIRTIWGGGYSLAAEVQRL